ncbi:MAG TPA: ComEC/Rec2 family competence protein, partial [Solirubrobacteraceae bacterium]|nr:ComEC/Rec2 family competence protein [Solirubrobacteraceae bacterium]
LAGRPSSRWYALLLAAAATLVANPRAAEDPGWQLSFAAVVAILALHRRLRDALVARGSPRAVAEVAALTIAATVATAPLLALHFEQVSLVALPANLLAAPAVAPVMWLGALAATLGDGAASAINVLAGFPLAYLAWLGRTAAAMPHASVGVSVPGPLGAAAMYGAMALGVLVARRGARWWSATIGGAAGPGGRTFAAESGAVAGGDAAAGGGGAAVGAGAAPLARPRAAPPAWRRAARVVAAALLLALLGATAAGGLRGGDPPRGFALSVLDVGQGDATLLQHGAAHAILVDTGPPGAGIVGKLRAAGVERLDAIVITHSSLDHEGGLREVLAAFTPRLVLDGRQTAEERAAEPDGGEGGGERFAGLPPGVARAVPEAGQTLRAGPLTFTVLWPPPGRPRAGDPNLTATVALVEDGETSALLTADAESDVTLPLDLPDVDVLKVAHHGSEDEGLPQLLEHVRPEVAVIPVGRNTYGHPSRPTLEALRAVPEVRRTDEDGTVRIEPHPSGGVVVR